MKTNVPIWVGHVLSSLGVHSRPALTELSDYVVPTIELTSQAVNIPEYITRSQTVTANARYLSDSPSDEVWILYGLRVVRSSGTFDLVDIALSDGSSIMVFVSDSGSTQIDHWLDQPLVLSPGFYISGKTANYTATGTLAIRLYGSRIQRNTTVGPL